MTLQKDIMKDANDIDKKYNTNLEESLANLIPSSKTVMKKMVNKELSKKVAGLFDACQMLKSKMSSRASRTNVKKRLIEEVLSIKEKVDSAVLYNVQNIESDPLLRGHKLTAIQRERKFGNNRIPKQEGLAQCLFCKHYSINEPLENDVIIEENRKCLEKFTIAKKVWDQYQKDLEKDSNVPKPTHPHNPNKTLNQKPRPQLLLDAVLLCHCFNSKCVQEGEDQGSSCSIECVNCETGERYPFQGMYILR